MTLSFRTRLFVVASAIVVFTLASVLALGWSGLLKYQTDRLDERLCMEARRLVTQALDSNDLIRLEADVLVRLRLASREQLLFNVKWIDGETESQSSRWSATLDAMAMSWTPPHFQGGNPDVPEGPGGPGGPPPGRLDFPLPPRADGFGPPHRLEPLGRPDRADRPVRPPPGRCSITSFSFENIQWRGARFELPRRQSVLAADLSVTRAELWGAIRQALVFMVPLALLLTALGAWLLSSLTMRPVNRLREAMRGVTKAALDLRLETAGEDREFKELITAYNVMLERLQQSFQQASRFSADAAHELKTPLTILRGRIEQAIQKSDNRAIQTDLTQLLDEVSRLAAVTRKLLLLSQADAGHLALHLEKVDLTELLDSLVQDAQMMTTEHTVRGDIARGLTVRADATLLTQLFNNLISNAVRYGKPGSAIFIHAKSLPLALEVRLVNATWPIAAADRLRFFDRFYRGDAAHTRGTGEPIDGNGLGLSLAREIARAHRGDLTLETSAADQVVMRLVLPTG